MQFEPDQWYHVYNRGNNSQRLFFSRENYIFFLEKMRKQIVPLADVIAYCLMPNHFHWMLHVNPSPPLPANASKEIAFTLPTGLYKQHQDGNPPPSDGCFRRLTGTSGKQYHAAWQHKDNQLFLPVGPS